MGQDALDYRAGDVEGCGDFVLGIAHTRVVEDVEDLSTRELERAM